MAQDGFSKSAMMNVQLGGGICFLLTTFLTMINTAWLGAGTFQMTCNSF
jgi:hypothetical protein